MFTDRVIFYAVLDILIFVNEVCNFISYEFFYFIAKLGTNNTFYGDTGNDKIILYNAINYADGGDGNDTISGMEGNETYNFSSGDGIDQLTDTAGDDKITFNNTVDKNNIAIYVDSNNNLIIDYGNTGGQDVINIQDQLTNTIEQVQLSNGEYMTSADINALIQNMTAYANNNNIEFTCVNNVKNNQDLMTMVANSWHA